METMYTDAAPGPSPREAISVLIVDDQAHARTYVRMVLRGLGVTTIWEAANGEEALLLYRQHRPTVVFLDNNMPVLSGKRTIERLREIDPAAAVVAVTSENDANTVRHFVEQHAIGYILKCSPREEVSQIIGEILDGFVVERR
jgi:DNA-binding NarL/FixJ family response regulator